MEDNRQLVLFKRLVSRAWGKETSPRRAAPRRVRVTAAERLRHRVGRELLRVDADPQLWGKQMASVAGSGSEVAALNAVPVLIVEDTWHVANVMKAALQQLGMQVVGPTATTAEARRLVAEEHPKVAIVDINLKRETADRLIEELHGQGVRVVVVSGHAAPPVSKGSVAAFLQKPVSGKELITTMHAVARLL
jgi:CheY-like chemotaxis protein